MALDLNPNTPAQAAINSVAAESANAPSTALAPASTPLVAPVNANPVSSADMAKNSIAAVQSSKGQPGDWARGILTGVLHGVAGLDQTMAGFGAEGKVTPGGSGALEGLGAGIRYQQAAARQRQLNQQENTLFAQKVRENDLNLKKAALENEHTKQIMGREDTTFHAKVAKNNTDLIKEGQTDGSLQVVSPFMSDKDSAALISDPVKGKGLTRLAVAVNPDGSNMYDVLSATGNHTLSPDEQAEIGKYAGKENITSEPYNQFLADRALAQKNKAITLTLNDAATKLGIDTSKLQNIKVEPKALGLFGSYYAQVAKKNPGADKVENIGEAYLHMLGDSLGTGPKAKSAQDAVNAVTEQLGGLQGLNKALDADQSAFDRMISANLRTANMPGPQSKVVSEMQKRVDQDLTQIKAWQSQMNNLQQIITPKTGITITAAMLKAAGVDSVQQAQQQYDTIKSQLATQIQQLATDRQAVDKMLPQTGPKMVTMVAPNGQTKQVPADQVDHYKSLGAKVQ